MAGSVTDWVEAHIDENAGFKAVGRSAENFLLIEDDKKCIHPVAVIGAKPVVQVSDVEPVLVHAIKPEFVINIPSKSIWTGSAIDLVHASPAGFGSLGDLGKAVRLGDVAGYRNKGFGFFERAIGQHSNVQQITRLYDLVFIAHRKKGPDLTIALIDAYNMSAEDVRHARAQYGHFDIALKMSSYGSVTAAAQEAARYMGAEAMMFRDIMGRLGR
ncbi:MAG: hypothetical protein E5V49_12995 [Mesorhizobium sp.]|nr:MAG: hypothetical protein E5V48_11105 [Mesorhizobium sp.]TJW32218.1 MAG: hypothetical protein E5V49_12995 [Mesorhizobium sp.]